MEGYHDSVLLREVIEALRIEKDSGVDDLISFSLSAFYPLQESLEYYYNGEASVEQLSSQKTSRLVPLALEK